MFINKLQYMWDDMSRQNDLNLLLSIGRIEEKVENLQGKLKWTPNVKQDLEDIRQSISFLKSQINKHKEKHIEADKKFIKIIFSIYGILGFILIIVFLLSLENKTAREVFNLLNLI